MAAVVRNLSVLADKVVERTLTASPKLLERGLRSLSYAGDNSSHPIPPSGEATQVKVPRTFIPPRVSYADWYQQRRELRDLWSPCAPHPSAANKIKHDPRRHGDVWK